MNALVFGATGMVGQAAVRASLDDPGVLHVLAVGRRPTGQRHEKLRDVVVPDLHDLSVVEAELPAIDACFFCVGVSSAGLSEERYTSLTYELTLAVARTLVRLNPGMTFIYLSGIRSSTMWYRIFYALTRPLWPLLEARFPNSVTTTDQLGRAMIAVARHGFRTPVLETRDINRL